eukprot:jgi/Botrbrau1/23278/Bobra.0102s0021.1
MEMYFTATDHVILWFKSWHIAGPFWYSLSLAALFGLGIFQEWLLFFRIGFASRASNSKASRTSFDAESSVGHPLLGHPLLSSTLNARFGSSALYALNLVISYLLMLAVMTYNAGYFLAIVGGLTVGHFVFQKAQPPATASDACCASPLVDLDV